MDEIQLSGDLSDRLKMAIGDAVTIFSKIDAKMLEMIWLLSEADLAKKKKLAREHSAGNMKSLEEVFRLIPGAETGEIWRTCEALRRERNLIAHGIWLIDQFGNPQVTWPRRDLESDDYTVVEHFSFERFDHFLEIGHQLLKTFSDIKHDLEEILPRPGGRR